jgi:hypothetical protein
MAGTLTISTLKDSSGVLATQNGMNGICKAWVSFNGSTQAISGSFNVSSITRVTTGQYTINFTTAMPDATYADFAGGGKYSDAINNSGQTCVPYTIGSLRTTASGTIYNTAPSSGTTIDTTYITYAVFR